MIALLAGKQNQILIALAVVAGMCWKAYLFGIDVEQGRQAKAVQESLDGQREALSSYYADQVDTKVIYREKTKIIRKAQDPTRCADSVLPVSIVDGLL